MSLYGSRRRVVTEKSEAGICPALNEAMALPTEVVEAFAWM
jgi:hypothetical protein